MICLHGVDMGRTVSRSYDAIGRLTRSDVAEGTKWRSTTSFMNSGSGISLTRTITSANAAGETITLTYDWKGNLISVKDAENQTTTFAYNNRNDLTSMTALDNSVYYNYDNYGVLANTVDRRGNVTSYLYDAGGKRLRKIQYADNSYTSIDYDADWRLTSLGEIAITYVVNTPGLVNTVATPQGTVAYTYDKLGRRTSMTAAGRTVSYTYTPDGLTNSIAYQSGGAVREFRFEYDSLGRRTKLIYPGGVASAAYSYDLSGRTLSVTVTNSSGVVLDDMDYTYEPQLGFVNSIDRAGVGDMLSTQAERTYTSGNRITGYGSEAIEHDPDGNMTSWGAKTFSWNSRNELTGYSGGGTTASYDYDPFGRRVSRTVNGDTRHYLYDGINAILITNGTQSEYYLYGPDVDEPLMVEYENGAYRLYMRDAQGSVTGMMKGTGALTTRYRYSPYGEMGIVNSDAYTARNPFRYTSKPYDAETGLYYYIHRYYSPLLGRFISEDPIGFGGGMNWYAYTGNNPVNFSDPLGLAAGDWWDISANFQRAYDIAQEELQKRSKGHNNAEDAMRHAEWNRRMVQETNSFTAWIAGFGHEMDGLSKGQPWDEAMMDLFNNAIGRAAGIAGIPVDPNKLQVSPQNSPTIESYPGNGCRK